MSINFFIFFLTWGVFVPYWTGWLVSEKALGVADAGDIMGFGLITRSLSTLLFYPLLSTRWNPATVLILLTAGTFVALLFYIPASSYPVLLIVTIIFCAIYPCLLPAMENAAGSLVQKGRIYYGKSRSYGSLGYIAGLLLVSALSGPFGEKTIYSVMVAGVFLLILLRFFPAPDTLTGKSSPDRSPKESLRTLFGDKRFSIVFFIVLLLHGSHASYYSYGYLYLQDLGFDGLSIGILLNIAVLFEILFFSLADRFFSDWKSSSLMLIGAIGTTVRWILYGFPNLIAFVISQSLHALSFAMTHYAFIRFITKTFTPKQNVIIQSLYSALAMSLSQAFMTLVGGRLYEWEPKFAFLGMLVCTLPAIGILLGTRNRFNY